MSALTYLLQRKPKIEKNRDSEREWAVEKRKSDDVDVRITPPL